MKSLFTSLLFVLCITNSYSQDIGIELITGFSISTENPIHPLGVNTKIEINPYLSAIAGFSRWNYTLNGDWTKEDAKYMMHYEIVSKKEKTSTINIGVEGSIPFVENRIHSFGFMGRITSYYSLSGSRDLDIHMKGETFLSNIDSEDFITVNINKTVTRKISKESNLAIAFMGGLYYRYKKIRFNLNVEQNGIDLYYDLRRIKVDDNVFMQNLISSPGLILWSLSTALYFSL